EDPKLTKTIVKRGVTELVTPGISINDNILDRAENNFLSAVHLYTKACGLALLDISTGEFLTAEGAFDYIDKLLAGFKPKEVLFEKGKKRDFQEKFGTRYYSYPLDDWAFAFDSSRDKLLKHFETSSLKGFGVEDMKLGITASGAILQYLELTQHHQISHINRLSRIEEDKYVWLDKFTVRNLELFRSVSEGGYSLIDVIDRTITPMGSRMLKRWVALPLKDVQAVTDRHAVVEHFFRSPELKDELRRLLYPVGDLERLVSKIATGRISPREMMQLRHALYNIGPIRDLTMSADNEVLRRMGEQLDECRSIREKIEREIEPDPPVMLSKGGVVRPGVSAELDELRDILFSGKDYLENLQKRESERTSIPSLKVGFNNVFGYFIEVRNTHKDKVPSDWIRKQTHVKRERDITEELKLYESKILAAEQKILSIEEELYNQWLLEVSQYIPVIQRNSMLLAQLDCLRGYAVLAEDNRYVRPVVDDSDVLDIKAGRHPVIETRMPVGESYIPNDLYLNNDKQQIIIITGPNMAGKSALLRQTALIVLLAQIGSFVPADSARIGIVDKIFTRVGASDNISQGESTFMVEMNEAASILNNLSDRSLVLFDELGRGTSTYDGISIAWS